MIRSGGGRVAAAAVLLAAALAVVVVIVVRAERRPEPGASSSPPPASNLRSNPPAPSSPRPTPAASACRSGNPLANVYSPRRLRLLSPCRTVTGIVTVVRTEADGDIHINLSLDAGQQSLLSPANRTKQSGDLVLEIVPADLPGCVAGRAPLPPRGTRDFGICTGLVIAAPLVGMHVRATGPWVTDTIHGWNEIHPVWRLELIAPALR